MIKVGVITVKVPCIFPHQPHHFPCCFSNLWCTFLPQGLGTCWPCLESFLHIICMLPHSLLVLNTPSLMRLSLTTPSEISQTCAVSKAQIYLVAFSLFIIIHILHTLIIFWLLLCGKQIHKRKDFSQFSLLLYHLS